MLTLGIETSCDETSASVVADGRRVLSNIVLSQILQHRPFGGVVPELASRCHVEAMPGILEEAVMTAGVAWSHIDAIAVTRGPGLASSLLIGVSAAKALGMSLGKPVLGIHHHEAHVYSVFLEGAHTAPEPDEVCPLLSLLVSGGHSILVRMNGVGSYEVLGQTIDDAAGECLDKGANLLKLGYPGGPAIERAVLGGDPTAFKFPRGNVQGDVGAGRNHLDGRYCFSFSGLKTSLLYHVKRNPGLFEDGSLKDVAASYQEAVFDALIERVERALDAGTYKAFACVGGVARNQRLRAKLQSVATSYSLPLLVTDPEFCTDNAAMIAGLAGARGLSPTPTLDVDPNWPLSDV